MQTKHDDHDDILAAAAAGDMDEVAAVLSMDNRLTNATDAQGRTPLHLAAAHGHVTTVDTLLHNNADPNARDAAGATALALAEAAGHGAVAARLRVGGALTEQTR
jgi:ankyrin repeat protein